MWVLRSCVSAGGWPVLQVLALRGSPRRGQLLCNAGIRGAAARRRARTHPEQGVRCGGDTLAARAAPEPAGWRRQRQRRGAQEGERPAAWRTARPVGDR